jgi:GT2 family glycosyltransferase
MKRIKTTNLQNFKKNKFVSVVIVTWNNQKDIQECLESISDQNYDNYNIIVVDNASNDDTPTLIEKKFPKVILLKQRENLYLTKGNNLGINYAFQNYIAEYILILNPDTKVEKNLISTLVNKIESGKNIGAVGPKLKFYKNKNEGLLNSAGLVYDGFMQAYDRGFLEKDLGQFDKDEYVFGVSGACILYSPVMLEEIGLYWTKIKLHLDEVELFIRARKKKWKALYTYETTVHHKYMQSADQNKLYKIEKAKNKAWLWIALRHYTLKSKLAMIKHWFSEVLNDLIKNLRVKSK